MVPVPAPINPFLIYIYMCEMTARRKRRSLSMSDGCERGVAEQKRRRLNNNNSDNNRRRLLRLIERGKPHVVAFLLGEKFSQM